jgi:hypothetical protein
MLADAVVIEQPVSVAELDALGHKVHDGITVIQNSEFGIQN